MFLSKSFSSRIQIFKEARMSHDVFISYSSKNKTVADAVCAMFEENKIRVWYAPRDVPPGRDFASAIISAIDQCKIFILIWSEESNKSDHILAEINHAFSRSITVIPFRIDNVLPTESLEYYIGRTHWLDAITLPLEKHLGKLCDTVKAFLATGTGEKIPDKVLPPVDLTHQLDKTGKEREQDKHRSSLQFWFNLTFGFLIVAVLAAVFWFFVSKNNKPVKSVLDSSSQVTTATGTNELIRATTIATNADSTSTPKPKIETATESSVLKPTSVLQPPSSGYELSDWQTVSFNIPGDQLWSQVEDQYTTVASKWRDTFAWSDEVFEGDLFFSFDVTSKQPPHGAAHIIVYGDGYSFSKGCLIFHFGEGFVWIEKNSIFHEGDYWLVNHMGDFDFQQETHNFTIEIVGDTVNFHVDGQIAASTSTPPEMMRQGKIGFIQHCEEEICIDVTYINPQIRTTVKED
jgi:hypothetical protein